MNKLPLDLQQKLNLETAQIRWHELQRYFSSGNAIFVDTSLDLIEVATQISEDKASQIKIWMQSGLLDVVKDSQAALWYEEDATVWALVIKPWVLVQPLKN